MLARFGGLRCPSEIVGLTWEDVDWQTGRLTVRSPKTEHHTGKESRQIPLFPEVKDILERALKESKTKTGKIVLKCKNSAQNLRTTFQKIVARAGLKPWPKLFQNLRSTRQTELCESFPSHVVSAWIGNSESIAKRHYLQVTEDHFRKASVTSSKPVEMVAIPVAMNMPEPTRIKPYLRKSRNGKSREIRGYSSGYVTVSRREMGAEDSNPRPPRCKRGALTN